VRRTKHLTAIIEREDGSFVALCPELDIASQGESVESASKNLREAIALFLGSGSGVAERDRRHREVYVTHFDLVDG